MDLKELLLDKHSKAHTTKIAKWIGSDQKRFDQLVKFLIDGEEPLPQRAGWVLFFVRSLIRNSYKNISANY